MTTIDTGTKDDNPKSKLLFCKELQLYTNFFTTCSHCNLPPTTTTTSHQKLLTCSNCASAAYHNSSCQRSHWKVHKKCCKKLSQSLVPLKELIRWQDMLVEHNEVMLQFYYQRSDDRCDGLCLPTSSCWWYPTNPTNSITSQTVEQSNDIWTEAVDQWNVKEYLKAMEGMQFALEVYQSTWSCFESESSLELDERIENDVLDGHGRKNIEKERDDDFFFESSMVLAKRLLFLAYCELDGGQVTSARQRLVQCISIANTILYSTSSSSTTTTHNLLNTTTYNHLSIKSILNDAYMELMLSMEEIESDKVLARHVANLAIINGNCCGWVDPMQRPGYMASIISSKSGMMVQQLSSVPICCSVDKRPKWCNELERNYHQILEEYHKTMTKNQWMDVGCGRRGSGHDDHSVVEGRGWKEYVLFGTGALDCEDDAPFTKQLLRQHVPDAVTLAQQGGGEVIFSRLSPHTHIKSHCGPTNLRWTAHLGLVIPNKSKDCRIRVGHEWVSWSAGKILLFDDSFEHEVRNDTDEERVVLLIRLWHPELAPTSGRTVGLASQLVQEAIAKKEESIQKRYIPPS